MATRYLNYGNKTSKPWQQGYTTFLDWYKRLGFHLQYVPFTTSSRYSEHPGTTEIFTFRVSHIQTDSYWVRLTTSSVTTNRIKSVDFFAQKSLTAVLICPTTMSSFFYIFSFPKSVGKRDLVYMNFTIFFWSSIMKKPVYPGSLTIHFDPCIAQHSDKI